MTLLLCSSRTKSAHKCFNVSCLFENAALEINSQKWLFVGDRSKPLLWPGSRWLPWASSHHSLQESENQIKQQKISFYLPTHFIRNMCSVLMEVWFKDQLVVIRFYSLVTVLNPILGTWQIAAVSVTDTTLYNAAVLILWKTSAQCSNLCSTPGVYGPCQTRTISSSRSSPCRPVWSGILRSAGGSAASLCSWTLRDPETPSVPEGQRRGRGREVDCGAEDIRN